MGICSHLTRFPPRKSGTGPGRVVQFANLLSSLLVRIYRAVSEGRRGSVSQVTEQVRQEVLRLHGEGKGISEIGRLLGLDRKQVARALAHEGIEPPPSTSATCRLPEILELRRQGVSITEIGRRLGFSRNAIRRVLRKNHANAG
jgi:DNA-binding NarL/FixJ family response regulator